MSEEQKEVFLPKFSKCIFISSSVAQKQERTGFIKGRSQEGNNRDNGRVIRDYRDRDRELTQEGWSPPPLSGPTLNPYMHGSHLNGFTFGLFHI